MLAERPDLLPPLLAGFRYHRFGEQPEGEPQVTTNPVPVFDWAEGRMSIVFLRTYIEMGARELATPLTPRAVEALDYLEQTARREDLRAQFMLEPGGEIPYTQGSVSFGDLIGKVIQGGTGLVD